MRKFFTNSDLEEPSLIIVSTLAIISILLHLVFPQHALVAKTNKDIGSNISQEDPSASKDTVLINQKNDSEIKESPEQKGKVLATQVESSVTKENIGENSKTIEAAKEIKVKSKKLVLVTAYSSTVDQTDSTPFITANGTHVHDGTIAANFLKFGTKVRFPSLYGDKVFIVEDRMKSNYKVDIWFPTRQEAINFGAKRVEMEIL